MHGEDEDNIKCLTLSVPTTRLMLILQTTPSSYCRDKIILIDHRRFIPTQQYNSRPKRKIDGQHKPRLLNLSIICSSNDRIKYSNRLGMISISRIVSVTATLIASLSLASAIMGGWYVRLLVCTLHLNIHTLKRYNRHLQARGAR